MKLATIFSLLALPAILLAIPDSTQAQTQAPMSDQQIDNLALLGRIWGFLKYYHPGIASGKIAWDDELLHFLPGYRGLTDPAERNDSLVAWIDRQGGIPVCEGCDSKLPSDAKLSPDFSWMDNAGLSAGLRQRLHFILKNRYTGAPYYVQIQRDEDVNLSLFQHEASYTSIQFPDSSYGLLCLFRLWNAIEYWYPYKYNLRTPWPEVLRQYIPQMNFEPTLQQYAHDTEELLTEIDDSHGYLAWASDKEIHGDFMLPFTLKFAGKWVITSFLRDSLAGAAGIRTGDVVESMDGVPMTDIVKQLAQRCPASNSASMMNKLCYPIIRRTQVQTRLVISRGQRRLEMTCANFQPKVAGLVGYNPAWFPFPKDSVICLLPGDIVYVNMGRLDRKDSVRFKALIAQSKGLVIDTRMNADEMHGTNAIDIVTAMLIPPGRSFVRFSSVDPGFPGVFRLAKPAVYNLPRSGYLYPGKIAILIDENTMSVGEIMSMAFRLAPGAKLIGTHTAGADGNVNILVLPGGGVCQFTGIGVYYPDGGETQRIGIQPDIPVKVTLDDFLVKRDVQLEKALLYLKNNP
jgi:hypothetical protein